MADVVIGWQRYFENVLFPSITRTELQQPQIFTLKIDGGLSKNKFTCPLQYAKIVSFFLLLDNVGDIF